MLQSQGLRAAYTRGGGNPASVSYRATYNSTTDASSYTFTSADIGTATDRSIVVVAIHYRSSSISSVTVGGVSATQVVSVGAGLNTAIYRASGVTGTTANIVVNLSGTASRCLVAVYALYNLRSNTPYDSSTTFTLGGTSQTRTLDTIVDGVIVAAGSANASRTFTWTGATENYDTVIESADSYSGASASATSNTTTTVSLTIAGGSAGITYGIASWR
jgi:hypothetical protein